MLDLLQITLVQLQQLLENVDPDEPKDEMYATLVSSLETINTYSRSEPNQKMAIFRDLAFQLGVSRGLRGHQLSDKYSFLIAAIRDPGFSFADNFAYTQLAHPRPEVELKDQVKMRWHRKIRQARQKLAIQKSSFDTQVAEFYTVFLKELESRLEETAQAVLSLFEPYMEIAKTLESICTETINPELAKSDMDAWLEGVSDIGAQFQAISSGTGSFGDLNAFRDRGSGSTRS